jgi:hypothetical protein
LPLCASSDFKQPKEKATMPFLPSIARDDKVPHVLAKFQNGTQMPLLEFHQALLRGDSPFTVKERELGSMAGAFESSKGGIRSRLSGDAGQLRELL